jgi:ubiquinone/menaquinone biosynthesis C-methylase UbiE
MAAVFGSPEMVQGYTRARPPVHPYVLELVRERLELTMPLARALDVGCGTGLSTSPLRGIAGFCLGLDPVAAMVHASPARTVGVRFAAARAEALPVRSDSIDIVTAAGSLNFADIGQFFPDAARVLRAEGALIVYDFSVGRRFPDSDALDVWFSEFLRRYPKEQGAAAALDAETLAAAADDFTLVGAEDFEVVLRMEPSAYRSYLMTETNVAHAIARGEDRAEIRDWLEESLTEVFGDVGREVLFAGYLAHLVRNPVPDADAG